MQQLLRSWVRTAAACGVLLATAAVLPAQNTSVQVWERLLAVNPAGDDVRDMAVTTDNEILVTINRNLAGPIRAYKPNAGQPLGIDLDQTGITGGVFVKSTGEFDGDNSLYVVNLNTSAGATMKVYRWADINSAPTVAHTYTNSGGRHGDAMDVIGSYSDESLKIIITGNQAGALPEVITMSGPGTFASAPLANAVQALDVAWEANGANFWSIGNNLLTRHNADGSVDFSVSAQGANGLDIDDARGLIYTMGNGTGATLRVHSMADGALLHIGGDLLDAGGFASSANGSVSLDIAYGASTTPQIYAMSERNGVARYFYGQEVTVPGDYSTIEAAIASYDGGTSQPLIVSADATTTHSTIIDLGSAGLTDPAGDLIIRSDTPGTLVGLAVGNSFGNDGIYLTVDEENVLFIDALLYPDITETGATDDFINVWDDAAPGTKDWLEFWNCVITEIGTDGAPLATDKTSALAVPPARGSSYASTAGSFQYVLNAPNTGTGEKQALLLDNSVIYGFGNDTSDHNIRLDADGSNNMELWIYNSIIAYSGGYSARVSTTSTDLVVRVLGDDAAAGPDSATMIYNTGWHGFGLDGGGDATSTAKLDNVIIARDGGYDLTATDDRGITGATTGIALDIDNSIISGYEFGTLADQTADETWSANTINSTLSAIYLFGGAGNLTVVDSVLEAGSGSVATQEAGFTGTLTVDFSGVSGGLAAIDTLTNQIQEDPAFKSTDPTSEDFLDVLNNDYATAATGGAALAGGANYEGGTDVTTVNNWLLLAD